MEQTVKHDPSFFDDDESEVNVEELYLTDDEVLRVCKREVDLADTYNAEELESSRESAMDYYFGRPRGDEVEGNSKTQSLDVSDMVEATLADIMPLFAHKRIAKFSACDDKNDSEDQAQTESNYCNKIFMEDNDGYNVLYQAVKDALLQKNGIVEVYVNEFVKVEYDDYRNLNDLELLDLMKKEPGKTKTAIESTENQDGTVSLTLKTMFKVKKLVCDPVEPENFLFALNHRSHNAKTMRFCGRRLIISRSDLISQGYDKDTINSLPPYDGSSDSEDISRNQTNAEDDFETGSHDTELVEAFRCYVEMDYDKDGISELHQVVYANDSLLERTFCKFVPFASGSPFLMSHRFIGLSLFDKLQSIQDQKTAFLRQYIDNATQMNNRRLEVLDGQVNMEDVLNSRPGGVIRAKVKGAVTPVPLDDIGPSIIYGLDYLDKVRAERGGSSLDMQSAELKLGGNAAQSTERQYTSKEKMAAFITRTLAETLVKQIYILVHANLREFFEDEYPVKVNEAWKNTSPSKWMKRDNVKMDIGMSAGERDKKASTLLVVLEQQKYALEKDAKDVLVSYKNVYNTLTDLADVTGIDNPNRYWIDPTSPDAIKAYQDKMDNMAKNAEESKKLQTQIYDYQKDIEKGKNAINVLKEENKALLQKDKEVQDIMKHNDEMNYKYTELQLKYDAQIPGKGINSEGDSDERS